MKTSDEAEETAIKGISLSKITATTKSPTTQYKIEIFLLFSMSESRFL